MNTDPHQGTAHRYAWQDAAPSASSPRAGSPAGWYSDPIQPGQRYFDGFRWTAQTAATGSYPLVHTTAVGGHLAAAPGYHPQPAYQPPVVMVNNAVSTVVVIGRRKSVGVAFLLTLMFGPLGMLYSTVGGALFMMLVSFLGFFFIGAVTLGIGGLGWLALCWFIAILWGCCRGRLTPAGHLPAPAPHFPRRPHPLHQRRQPCHVTPSRPPASAAPALPRPHRTMAPARRRDRPARRGARSRRRLGAAGGRGAQRLPRRRDRRRARQHRPAAATGSRHRRRRLHASATPSSSGRQGGQAPEQAGRSAWPPTAAGAATGSSRRRRRVRLRRRRLSPAPLPA